MNALLLVIGVVAAILGCFLLWKLVLRAVKGVARAVAAGIAEGRADTTEAQGTRPQSEPTPDITDELLKATYLLGVSELERAPNLWGYDPHGNVFEPSEAEIASETVSMTTLGKAISKLSPVDPARTVLEETAEKHVRENVGAKEADDLAKLHKEARMLEIFKVGAQVRAEKL
jgi:hypothetical protein